ncbi:abortive infection AbiH-like protein [Paraburkholderia sp. BL18I3N2]|uniref:bacteriophage abortive infection AbiH family protein n=1 Tax=Paraburkholderia sp. BL18I3N2 TaxID=1938799 RepID=UPI000D067C20|nr:bacteriophage abortive infection AbiH family protein [Paraburkholderia sp. BL18I3N2]PRX20720.1 abortive infection AbiH-like protein [Paraburkholderia sp. BL18I3N2]
MISRTLYVIGNGFDLWHGIPSSYSCFRDYVRLHGRDVFDAVESYLPAGENWSDLEAAFGEIDVDHVIESLGQFMGGYGDDDWSDSGHHDFQYEVERVVERLSGGLRFLFGEWIRQLPIPTTTTVRRRLHSLDKEAIFLTFNYTKTLREIYGVADANVLHIHGNADLPDSELILGHAWHPERRRSLNDRPDIEEIDVRLAEAHDILDDYFSQTFKPSAQIVQAHCDFFALMREVEEVVVLGHSLSDVDEPYFEAMLAVPALRRARWTLACREDAEEKSRRIHRFGVTAASVRTVSWDAL